MSDFQTSEAPKKAAPKRWSLEEEQALIEAFQAGTSVKEIATTHERSTGAIQSRLHQLDLISFGPYTPLAQESRLPGEEERPVNSGSAWDLDDEKRLLEMHQTQGTPEALVELAVELERSPRSLVLKLVSLGAVEEAVNPNPNPQKRTAPPKKSELKASKKSHRITEPEPQKMVKVKVTAEFQAAHKSLEAGENVLVLGSAGTGKSTFLKWIRHRLLGEKKFVVLAPTGMAALQVGGQTLHSFFGFKSEILDGPRSWRNPRNPKLYEKLDVIIIDEISMVRADMFQAIDSFLRMYGPKKNQSFGGVQVLLLGDLFQLPPIVRREEAYVFETLFDSPFFFSAPAWRDNAFETIEFTEIFRQEDEDFISLLREIRYGNRSEALLDKLNARVVEKPPKDAVVLAARNATVERINTAALRQLGGKEAAFMAKTSGRIDEKNFNSPKALILKVGARVMLTKNDPAGRWVNGSTGEVIEILEDEDAVRVKLDSGKTCTVEPVTWELTQYTFDEIENAPVATVAGSFTQLPLTLAWALTIHKAQGQTLEHCALDLSDGGAFAEGQLYVALSRARSLERLYLVHPVTALDVRTSAAVQGFMGF